MTLRLSLNTIARYYKIELFMLCDRIVIDCVIDVID